MIEPVIREEASIPFIDVAVGGHELPGSVNGFTSVWAVNINGSLYYRKGVTATCPEGSTI